MGKITDSTVGNAIKAYHAVNPSDLRDTEAHMSKATAEHLVLLVRQTVADSHNKPVALQLPPLAEATLFGLPIRLDERLPFGTVEMVTENATDRAIRRANEQGRTLSIVKYNGGLIWRDFPQPVKPTLRALLKHWWKKVKWHADPR